MEILSSQINNNFKFIDNIKSKNNSYIIEINNKQFIAKIILLIDDKDNVSKEKVIKINNNIIDIYNSLIPKNIVLNVEKINIFEKNNKLFLFTLTQKVFGDLSELPKQTENFYLNTTYQVLDIFYILLDEDIVYFDVKLQNFLYHNKKVYITDFEENYIKKIVYNDKILVKTIFTLQFYLYYLSFRKHYNDFPFFKDIRFFGSNEKILEFFLDEKFYSYLFEYLIYESSDFLSIFINYLTPELSFNSLDIYFIKKMNEKNYLKNINL